MPDQPTLPAADAPRDTPQGAPQGVPKQKSPGANVPDHPDTEATGLPTSDRQRSESAPITP